ncbi:MAG: hypothetical protein ACRDJC_07055 [Thermomicrobiales bacterium]
MTFSALSFKLRDVARSGEWTTEQAIAPIAGIDPAHPGFTAKLGAVLDAIDRAEDAEGRPLLSAVVVMRATGMPGATFFAFARERELHGGGDDRALWERELQRVHDDWYRH